MKVKEKLIGKYVETEELGELGFFDYEKGEDLVELSYRDCIEGIPYPISRLEEIIKEHKDKGATHIRMEYHVDHQSYLLQFSKIEL